MIAANRQIIERLPNRFDELNDGCHCLEQILDQGDGIINNCVSDFTASNDDSKPSGTGANIKTKITAHQGTQTKDIDVFDITKVGPDLVSQ